MNAVVRVVTGSGALCRQFGCWLLPGSIRATSARLTGTSLAAAAGFAVAHHSPVIMWPAVALWCLAAWRTGTVPSLEPADTAPSHDDHRAALIAHLDQLTAGRNGVHLAQLYNSLRQRPALADLTDAELRAVLAHYAILVVRSLSVDGVSGRSGVRRADVEALLREPAPLPGKGHSRPAESRPELPESRAVSPDPDPLSDHFSDVLNVLGRKADAA